MVDGPSVRAEIQLGERKYPRVNVDITGPRALALERSKSPGVLQGRISCQLIANGGVSHAGRTQSLPKARCLDYWIRSVFAWVRGKSLWR